MTALELISSANQVLFIGLFVAVVGHALRHPSRASFDTLLLFGSIAGVVVVARGAELLGASDSAAVTSLVLVLLNIAPLAMIRLVDDFSGTPRWIQIAGVVAFVVVGAMSIAMSRAGEPLIELMVAWFGIVGGYAAYAFARAAARTHGITSRRMTAVAIGAVLFISAVVLVIGNALVEAPALSVIGQILALAAVLAFFLGFAPPAWVRRAWREPDLRGFIERSIHIAGLDGETAAISQLQAATAAAFGARGAAIGLVIDKPGVLRYLNAAGEWIEYPDDAFIGGRAFQEQRRVVALDAGAVDPENAAVYARSSANTVIAAPVNTDERRVGVLTVFADRAPVFIEDDLWLLELLANQAAVILDARKLSVESANMRSREDAARLKEEFLSAAAHDLRTPLTVVLGQAELLERRLARDPGMRVDPAGVARMTREARRLRDLVSELLDAQRLDQGAAVMDPRPTDLRSVLDSIERRFHDQGLDIKVTVPDEPLVSSVDTMRIEQVVDNLVENALKYTANGQLPEVELSRDGDRARIAVIDHGVGIPEDEREKIFERFYRASNVQSITDTGMGLGLYICQRIVEAHAGRIRVDPTPGGGSTFTVSLPAQPAPAPMEVTEEAAPTWIPTEAESAADA